MSRRTIPRLEWLLMLALPGSIGAAPPEVGNPPAPIVAPPLLEIPSTPDGPPPLDPTPTLPPPEEERPRPMPTFDPMLLNSTGIMPDGMGGPMVGRMGGGMPLSYGASWYPSQSVQNQNASFQMERQTLAGSLPLYVDERNTLSFLANTRWSIIQTNAILPDSKQKFPGELWNINGGLSFTHRFDNGWQAGGTVSVGSASDAPFASLSEMNFGINAFLRVPTTDRSAWLFTIMYAPTGEFPFPIPGVAYMWSPSEQFTMNIGLPFMLNWQPTEQFSLNVTYLPLRTILTRATYRPIRPLSVYTGFEWTSEAYFLQDRSDPQQRLINYEKRVMLGLQWQALDKLLVDVSGGYAFDRLWFTGRQYIDNNHDRIDLPNTPYMALRIMYRY